MREVSKDAFYRAIGAKNVTPTPEGSYPYTSVFATPEGVVHGKIVKSIPEGQALPVSRYMLPEF